LQLLNRRTADDNRIIVVAAESGMIHDPSQGYSMTTNVGSARLFCNRSCSVYELRFQVDLFVCMAELRLLQGKRDRRQNKLYKPLQGA
jgi:hypothetical protein